MKIKSIIQALGWKAIYSTDDCDILREVVCWALTEGVAYSFGVERTENVIIGMVGEESNIVAADSIKGFKGYKFGEI